MKEDPQGPATVDDYIARCAPEVRPVLERLRAAIREAAPGVAERIAWGMPAFRQGEDLVYIAAFKHHVGFFPGASGIDAFRDRLCGWILSKGTVRFPLGVEPPYDLVREMVRFRAGEAADKAAARRKRRSRKPATA